MGSFLIANNFFYLGTKNDKKHLDLFPGIPVLLSSIP